MNNIIVEVNKTHFAKATSYVHNNKCPLAEALKELYPNSEIEVFTSRAYINGKHFKLKGWTENWLHGGLGGNKVEELMDKAKDGKRVRKYNVTLIRDKNDDTN